VCIVGEVFIVFIYEHHLKMVQSGPKHVVVIKTAVSTD
jgi:hypothetical protein